MLLRPLLLELFQNFIFWLFTGKKAKTYANNLPLNWEEACCKDMLLGFPVKVFSKTTSVKLAKLPGLMWVSQTNFEREQKSWTECL